MMNKIINEKYRLLNEIDSGGMGIVWQAENIQDKSTVAIKIIREEIRNKNIENLLRFKKEAELLKRANHANIVQMYDFGESDHLYYIAMEYIDGQTLTQFLNDRLIIDLKTFLDIGIPIAHTLSFIHKHNIIHGDIKPGNIMIVQSEDGLKIKLLDFGIALLHKFEEIVQQRLIGSFSYMSPEQSGILKRPIDQRSDLYSLGILFYQMLTGNLPYQSDSIYELIHKHIASNPLSLISQNQDVPMIVEKVVLKLMEKDISDRYLNADLLEADLLKIKAKLNTSIETYDFNPGESEIPDIRLLSNCFIGRERELGILSGELDEVLNNRLRMVSLGGEAGVGKTRLIQKFQDESIGRKGIFLSTSFNEFENTLPYSGILNCINQFFDYMEMFSRVQRETIKLHIGEHVGKLGGLLVKHIPALSRFVNTDYHIEPLEHEKEKIRFDNLLVELLYSLTRSVAAIILFIDNMQWSDESTIELLDKILEKDFSANLLIICGSREADIRSPWGLLKKSCESRSNFKNIDLGPLMRNEVAAFLVSIFPRIDNLDDLTETIYRKTAGNAFFINQFIQLLLKEELMVFDKGWVVDLEGIESLPYTENAASLIKNTIKKLDEEHLFILSKISVLGNEFTITEASACFAEIPEKRIYEAIDAAKAMDILLPGRQRISFSHDIVYEVFYHNIDEKLRSQYHEDVAAFYEGKIPENEDNVFSCSYHYGKSSNLNKRLDYLKKSGRLSYKRKNYNESINYYKMYLELLGDEGQSLDGEQCRIFETMGEAYTSLGDYNNAMIFFNKALDLVEDNGCKSDLYQKLSYPLIAGGRYEEAIDVLFQSLRMLGEKITANRFVLVFKILKEVAGQIINSYFPGKFLNRNIADDNIHFKKQKIYQKLGLVCLWSMKRELTMFSHFKALNLGQKAGISEELIEVLITHIAVLLSIDGPRFLIRRMQKRLFLFLKRTQGYLEKLNNPPLITSFFNAVYAGIDVNIDDLQGDPVQTGTDAINTLFGQGTITFLLEISNCQSQILEYTGQFAKLKKMAEQVLYKAEIFNNESLHNVGSVYECMADFFLGKKEHVTEKLKSSIDFFEKQKDQVNFVYCGLFLFKSYCRDGLLLPANDLALRIISIIRKNKQTHPLVMARIFPFFVEELILSFLPQAETRKEKKRIVGKIIKFRKKCKSLSRVYHSHKSLYYRISALFYWKIRKNDKKSESFFNQAMEFLETSHEVYNRGVIYYYYGKFLLENSQKTARDFLEKAYLELDKCGAIYEMKAIEKLIRQAMENEPGNAEQPFTPRFVQSPGIHETGTFTFTRELDTVIDIGKKIGSIHKIENLLNEIMSHAIELVGAEQGELFLYEEGRLVSKGSSFVDGALQVPVCQGVISKVDYSGNPLVVNDAGSDPVLRNDPDVIQYNLKSILCVPLISKDTKIGILYLGNQHVGGLFSEHELDLLNAMAGQAAIAIENSLLFRQTKQLQTYLNNIIDSMPGAIIALDVHGNITHCNISARNFLINVTQSSIGKNIWLVAPQMEKYREAFGRVISEKTIVELQKEPFGNRILRITFFPLAEEVVTGVGIKLNDVTEFEKNQRRLIQAQKMEAVGTLVGGLAHDFNNILGGIQATISFLSDFVLPSKEVFTRDDFKDEFRIVNSSVDRAAALVRQLMTISIDKKDELVAVNMKESLFHVIKICKKSFDKSIEFEIDVPEEEPVLAADPAQLEQVILNLCINASHAMTIMRSPGEKWGGILDISIKRMKVTEDSENEHLSPGDYWRFSIRDNGVGMDEAMLEKIYEPFFTTKETGKGTGLGLAMVYSIISNLNGTIHADSELGKGTVFYLDFPVLDEKTVQKNNAEDHKLHRGTGSVLIIEDEDVLRRSVSRMLEAVGYTVYCAEDGLQGKKLFLEKKDDLSLVILDMVMPGLSGRQVYLEIKKTNPDVKVILTSGFAQDERVGEVISQGVDAFLEKPYSQKQLFDAMEKLM